MSRAAHDKRPWPHLWIDVDQTPWRLECDACGASVPASSAGKPRRLARLAELVVAFVGVHGECGGRGESGASTREAAAECVQRGYAGAAGPDVQGVDRAGANLRA